MDLRYFFRQYTWWGKLIGAFLGYLMAGPVGAFFGVLIGNFFDKGLTSHFNNPHWFYHQEKREAIQKEFFEATFMTMGHIAKTDGRVTEEAILAAKQLMKEMGLSGSQVKIAQDLFNQGKSAQFDVQNKVLKLRQIARDNPALLNLFIDIQYRAAKIGGLTLNKQNILNTILHIFGFAPLNQQFRFYADFDTIFRERAQSNQRQSEQQSYYYSHPTNNLAHAYAILEISPDATKQEVKRAYRRLISRNHPDKLIAQGLPEAMIKLANEKTQKIGKAYEEICRSKGW